MIKTLPTRISDFKELISSGYYIGDKSLFIKDIIDKRNKISVIVRPSGFGKTTNMSMLKYFFDINEENSKELFNSLYISNFLEYKKYQNKYPVIFISLKDIKYNSWEEIYKSLKSLIKTVFTNFSYLLKSEILQEFEKEYFYNVLESDGTIADYSSSLVRLTNFLYKHHNIKPILLIDEYDIPMQKASTYKCRDDLFRFMNNWLRGTLNSNISLELSVLTGTIQIANTSIFIGLNNLEVSSFLDDNYSQYFNITQ